MGELYKMIIGGEFKESGETIDVIYPYTGEVFSKVCLAGCAEAEEAIILAKESFKETVHLPAYRRKEILERLAELVRDNAGRFAEILVKESGKTITLAGAEVARSVDTLMISAEEAVRINGELIPLDRTPAGEGREGIIKRFPVGTVLAITPFNYPLNLACHKIGPAIAAGNPFILKPSSKTPLSALLLGELILKAGYPKRAVNVLPCCNSVAESMAKDERIAYLSFTGSPDVGWHLKSVSGRKRVGLELGGNAPVIVHSDADLDRAAERIAFGACLNAGQVCISVQRVLVQNSVYEKFLEKLSNIFESIKTGDPMDEETFTGPLISDEACEKAVDMMLQSIEDGALQYYGGGYEGRVITPTILAGTCRSMEVECEEIFAPVVTVNSYESFKEAVDRANDTKYGLQAGVFTDSMKNASYAAGHLKYGGVIINDIPTFRTDAMPYGGIKSSGLGKEGPYYAIREMTEEKLIVFARK
ncbi:aldehyde dehydrogenase family protein [Methanoplanus limicola]|uniref:Aldehyde Dehydrogenase n=1 Tax=Methanoplanus limicola DSM 2279 TaxID=937775 RepID=H1YYQ9_9EURY|nr:aldehyde dehydrogenase family protein [Methanoplanus limicola]EHQ36042.1 Aldehyde Dehydrogenase [Methanoplanus limicola DSM 2279]